ncbi:MAG TPA: DNA gyrase inhibitor YacG [Candidatus Eisenbacteria bacterium]|nr:DNA gyrase inhibitor YacG [Candidatus Eisenbacteria bacterium]
MRGEDPAADLARSALRRRRRPGACRACWSDCDPRNSCSGVRCSANGRAVNPVWQARGAGGRLSEVQPRRCPICRREIVSKEEPHRPFCSERCRLLDLSAWISDRYRIAGEPLSARDPADDEPS